MTTKPMQYINIKEGNAYHTFSGFKAFLLI